MGILKFRAMVLAACVLVPNASAWAQSDEQQAEENAGPLILAPIMVTGELIDRTLEETGTSAVVLDQTDLEDRAGLESVGDVINQTSNMTGLDGTIYAPTIRGLDGTGPAIGGNAFLAGTRPRLDMQIDGRPGGYYEIIYGDMQIWDVERVEILRGPQSTVVGRNSIAGTILVETNDPIFVPEAQAQLAGGNLEQRRASGMINVPIVDDRAAFRFTFDEARSASQVNYTPYPGVGNPAEKRSEDIRGKLLLLPKIGYDTEIQLTANYHRDRVPQGEIVREPYDQQFSDFPNQPVHNVQTNSLVAEVSTSVTDEFKLEVEGVYKERDFDREATAAGAPATSQSEEYVFEPKILFENDEGYSAVAGMYYYRSDTDEFIAFGANQFFDDKTETYAGYAEGIIPLSDQFDLMLGARYEREHRFREGGDAGALVDFFMDETFEAFLPKASLTWKPTSTVNLGAMVSRGFNAGGGGTTSPFPAFFPVTPFTYDEEFVTNYELFGRQTLFNGTVRTTQNIFYAFYDDMQMAADVTPTNTLDGAFVITNFNKVETYGAEFGVSALLTDTLTLNGEVGLLFTEILDGPEAYVGNQLHSAPNFSGNVSLVWKKDGWRASVAARYKHHYHSELENHANRRVDPYVVADAAVSYEYRGFEVFGRVKNLFDYDDPIALYNPSATTTPDARAVLHQPRTVLMGMKASF